MAGDVRPVVLGRPSRHPPELIYLPTWFPLNIYDWACWARQITEAGRREMLDWTRELVSTPEPEHPKFAAGLSVQMILSPDEVIALLRARLGRLEDSIAARRAAITEHLKEVPRLFLVEDEFAVAMVEAEAAWVRALLEELTTGSFPDLASWRAFHDSGEMPPELVELSERGLTDD